uniref:Exonuclease 1 n=1 Tax=Oryzias latipes TaxID=8090 RepID=H2L8Q1_ORYLA
MGITGLLQFIKDAAEPINVKKYKGQTVAVDTYCWLHKGAFSCAEKLAKGEPTDQYVWYCLKFVDMLLNFSIKPILVFDGRNLPSKQEVEKARRERREANLQKGRRLLREGKLSEARDCFTRCVNITPAMAHNLIKAARARGVDCLVAPYEADAQLAYLTKSGLAQAVITEDSDLLAFGCKTVILKMDKQGNGLEIDQGNLGRCRSLGNIFTEEKFRYMCILSGCDYLPSLHGIGLGKACKLLRLAKDPDILKVIKKMGQYLKMNLVVPEEYVEGFIRANNTFLHQLVFDPVQRKVIPLNPYPEHTDPASLSYAGLNPGDDRGLEMALGNLDFNTMERIDDFSPDNPQQGKHRTNSWKGSPASSGGSIWSRGFTPAPPPQAAASPHRPPPTRGQERVISVDRLLQVKRPREDCDVPDQEVLEQYSTSVLKRSKSETPDRPVVGGKPRTQNRFATLLQRRNRDEEEDDSQATFSRSAAAGPPGDKSSLSIQTQDSDGPDWPSVETPSPSQSPTSSPPSSAKQGLQLFQWSGGSSSLETARASKSASGLAALQQFHYKRETFSSLQTGGLPRDSPSPDKKSEDSQLDSSPSQDSAYFSQSQPQLTPCDREEAPAFDAASVRPNKLRPLYKPLGLRQTPPPCLKYVSGLSKLNSSGQLQATKTRALGPARASGLRKKPSASGKKDSPPNNENSPGVQATISGLWKNFSFKKDAQRLSPCRKGKPMSPVKDNVVATCSEPSCAAPLDPEKQQIF